MRRIFVSLSWVLSGLTMFASDAFDRWEKVLEWRSFQGIAFGDDHYVAYGMGPSKYYTHALTYTSADGRAWTRQLHPGISARSLAFGNGVFVMTAVASGGGLVLSSRDGVEWNRQDIRQWELTVQFVNGSFFLRDGDQMVTSTDGTNWTNLSSNERFGQLAFGNGVYAAVGPSGSILSSTDASDWAERIAGETEPFAYFFGTVAFGSGIFLAANNSGMFRSTNAVDWIESQPRPFYDCRLEFESGRFYAFSGRTVHVSPNGADWALLDTKQASVNSLAGDGAKTLLVGDAVLMAANGTDTEQLGERESIPIGVYEVPNGTAVIGNSYPELVTYLSKDGVGWTRYSTNLGQRIEAIVQVAGELYAFPSYQPGMYISNDAVNWTHRPTEPPLVFRSMVLSESGQWAALAVTNAFSGVAMIATSHDGIHWTRRLDTPGPAPNRLLRGNGVYLAVRAGSSPPGFGVDRYYISLDGIQWQSHTNAHNFSFVDVTFGKGVFASIALMVSTIRTSLDGVHWTPRLQVGIGHNVSPGVVESIRFHDGTFLAAGTRIDPYGYLTNTVLSSSNGIRWATNLAPANSWTHASFFARGRHYLMDAETVYRQAAVPVRFGGIKSSLEGSVELGVYANEKTPLRLLASTNLVNWELDVLLTNDSSSFWVPTPRLGGARFFRLQE